MAQALLQQHSQQTGLQEKPLRIIATTSQLLLGDCRNMLASLPDGSIDCIITDPPYGIQYQSRSHALPLSRIANDDERAYKLLEQALALAWCKMKYNRHLYIFTNWQAYAPMAEVVKKYFTLKNVLVWVKNNRTRGDLKGNYGYQHELVLYAHKGRRHLVGNRDGNILQFDKVPSNHMQHPTEKPVKLLEYLIAKSTTKGEVVLDMFMGVGSTCLAAKQLGRRYIGIELEPAWFNIALARLA
jgi:site-specific DNA-methyltransferase (adenine-specific)